MSATSVERPPQTVTAFGYGARVGLALLFLTAVVTVAIEWWPSDLTPIAGCA